MFNRYKLVIASIMVVLLSACGSGGGGGGGSSTSTPAPTPTDTNLAFQSFPAGYFSSGYTETYQVTGSDTVGGTYTATLSSTTLAPTTFNGQPAIPVQKLVKITNTQTGAFVSGTGTDYFSTDSGSRMLLGYTDDSAEVTKIGLTMNIIPQSATIDDVGVIGSYTGNVAGGTKSASIPDQRAGDIAGPFTRGAHTAGRRCRLFRPVAADQSCVLGGLAAHRTTLSKPQIERRAGRLATALLGASYPR